jgi:hypothetical protein
LIVTEDAIEDTANVVCDAFTVPVISPFTDTKRANPAMFTVWHEYKEPVAELLRFPVMEMSLAEEGLK